METGRSAGRRVRTPLALFFFYLTLFGWSRGETNVDRCEAIHGKRGTLGSLTVRSHNLVVDSIEAKNYDGDRGRFKRPNENQGHVTYVSSRGFERVVVVGYVFASLPKNSWTLTVRIGAADADIGNTEGVIAMTEDSLGEYQMEGGANKWRKFVIKVPLAGLCPPRVTVLIEGAASNNEFAGWGVQMSEVRLLQSWFPQCEAKCEFNETVCANESPLQLVDPAGDFRDVYSKTSNIATDDSSADEYFGGDEGRFKRTNNKKGEIIYASTDDIRMVEVELYQFKPFDTEITVLPYVSKSCRPVVLTPTYKSQAKRLAGGWIQRIARFDFRALPFCPKYVAIHLRGGQQGWELQISRITFLMVGSMQVDPKSSYQLRLKSDSKDDGGSSSKWWIWVSGLLGAAVLCLLIAAIVRRVALCFGDDERSIYHISNFRWFGFRRGEAYDTNVASSRAMEQPHSPSRPLPEKDTSFRFNRPSN